MTNEIRSLNDSELDLISGGVNGYKLCSKGSMAGGGAGLYPNYVECAAGTLVDGIKAFYKAATGKDLPV